MNRYAVRFRPWCGIIAIALLTTGCNTQPVYDPLSTEPGLHELTAVPFYPQTGFQCGPAALATVLSDQGLDVSPDQLSKQVYLPKRFGSLQVELLAAARRHQKIPYLVEGFDDLVRQVTAGTPVLVLQRVRNWLVPAWHYAVVVGFDSVRHEVILRSGTEKRRVVSEKHFQSTWAKGGRWGFVVLSPGKLPSSPDATRYLAAVINTESQLSANQGVKAYQVALELWPDNIAARFGLGNMQYRDGQLQAAKLSWQAVLQQQKNHAGAANNLAELLAEMGEIQQAINLLNEILSGPLATETLRPALNETLQELLKKQAAIQNK